MCDQGNDGSRLPGENVLTSESLPDLSPFQPTRVLGEGKTGQVYLAELPDRTGTVAVKVLRPEVSRDLEAVKRYLGVARKLVKIKHAALARLVEARRLADNRIVVVTEYVDGQDLGAFIHDRGTLAPDLVAILGHQLSGALAAAHAGGVVHLGLKPSNVVLSTSGTGEPQAKLLDFGMSELIPPGSKQAQDPYRSPEQRDGKPGDARSDLYSLGAMLYEALAGRKPRRTGPGLPFARPERGTMIPLRLEALVLKCLAHDPDERPSAEALADALTPLLPAPPPPPPRPQSQPPSLASVNEVNSPGSFSAVTKQQDTEIVRVCPACASRFPPEIDFCSHDGTRLPAPAVVAISEEDPNGPRTVGSYRLLRLIGEGGMGRVFLAEHTLLGRRVALKMLLPEFSRDASSVSRFFHEARVVNQIGHDNIVDITDFVENVGGDNYYVMEYLDGNSLKTTMEQDGAFPPDRVVQVGIQIAEALSAAHQAGAIHRDLKPDNIFLLDKRDRADFVKLLDFGIAKLINAEGMSLQTTIEGAVLGTPEYMSPEQASGEAVDARTDVYSLGVILYMMATNQLPITAPNYAQLLIKLIGTAPRRPAELDTPIDLPPALEALIMRCLAKDPDERFDNMVQLEGALQGCLHSAVAAETEFAADAAAAAETLAANDSETEISAQLESPAPRRRLGLVLGLLALLTLALVVGAVLAFGTGDEPDSAKANESAKPEPAGNDAGAGTPEATAAPAKISVAFASEPEGAQVFHGDAKKPLGKTPFMSSLAPSQKALSFTFRLEGHQAVTKQAAIAEGAEIHAQLTRSEPTSPSKMKKKKSAGNGKHKKTKKKKKKKAGTGDEDETLDPFAL